LFILTRIKELHDKGLSNNEAVAKGIASTSSLITGAAAIMVIVFGDFFIAIDNTSIQQLGLGLAVAVFLDATIVRTLLLPAAMRLMGEWNWWLPGFLNWLPKVRIELEEEAKSETAPELAEVVTNAPVKMR
jgi:putative drug exporter of the RND superfamily